MKILHSGLSTENGSSLTRGKSTFGTPGSNDAHARHRGFRSSFDRGCLSLWFNFRRNVSLCFLLHGPPVLTSVVNSSIGNSYLFLPIYSSSAFPAMNALASKINLATISMRVVERRRPSVRTPLGRLHPPIYEWQSIKQPQPHSWAIGRHINFSDNCRKHSRPCVALSGSPRK
jgi:hypothetical protein